MKKNCLKTHQVIFLLLFVLFSIQSGTIKADTDTILQEKIVITGAISDERGEPVIGANVVVKGTTNGAITDIDGNYSISASANDVLQISFIGYETIEVRVRDRKKINVVLQESSINLDEVVAIGYGSVKKRDLTGAVASIKGDELMKTNPVGINQALLGKMAGVQVSQADGAPGAGINIQIRGANSFTTSTEPLYIIDGVPFGAGEAPAQEYGQQQTNNPLSLINPQDVQSIEVLKDASATAIYGSRGANGVVIITTKQGTEGKARVDLSMNFSVAKPVKLVEVLDGATYAEYRNELQRNGYLYDGKPYVDENSLDFPIPGHWSYTKVKDPVTGIEFVTDSTYKASPQDFRNGYMNGGTDWQDLIYQTAFSQEYNLSISGGDSKGHYLFSGGYLDQQGIIYNSYYKRMSVRSNIDRHVNDWLYIGNNLTFTKSTNRLARTNGENYGIIPSAMGFNPTRPVFDPNSDSGTSQDLSTGLSNPYLYTRTAKNIVGALNIFTSAFAEITFTDYLKFRQNFGYGYNVNKRNEYYNRWVDAGVNPTNGYATQSDNYYESVTTESMLTFNKTFNDVHSLNAVAAWTYECTNWGGKWMYGKNFPNDLTEDNDMGAALLQPKNSSNRGKSQLMSYLARVNYTLLDRYMFTASYRRDGSSRFAPVNRWSNFASGAVAWRISDEEFIKNLNFFDDLKLRLSYGQTGNQGISPYATRSRMISQIYPFDGSPTSGYSDSRWGGPANPNLKWETTNQYNGGLDVSVFDGRVNLVVDLYYKNTKDLLQDRIIDPSTGFNTLASNYGNITNKGLEIGGNFYIINNQNFTWKMDANISFNRNKVHGLNADQFSDVVWGMDNMFLRRNGYSVGIIYGYVEDGYYDNEAEVRADPKYKNESDAKIKSMIGQVKYKDLNGDDVIDERDREIIGDTNPNFQYGMTNTFTYKNFTLSFFFQGTQGNDILNVNLKKYDLASITNMPRFLWEGRWTSENRESAITPRPDNTYTRSMKASDRYVENGSYLRMKNLSLSYRFIRPLKGLESINLTANVTNLFTITKYRWCDPDVNTFGSDVSRRGVDMNTYPSARTFNFGLQVSF